jgi:3-deoxy-D-manno-octulosonate 8-phosphate phosphatase (KDO 8-P phosphatase)
MSTVKASNVLNDKLKKIKMLLLDVDGVLTDGGIILGSNGQELKVFDVQDGLGITLARSGGMKIGMITGRRSEVVALRAQELHVDALYQGVGDKLDTYTEILDSYGLQDGEVCYVGDDLSDVPVMRRVGVAVAVANAREEVKKVANYITNNNGGRGAVREVVELLLKSKGNWKMVLEKLRLSIK